MPSSSHEPIVEEIIEETTTDYYYPNYMKSLQVPPALAITALVLVCFFAMLGCIAIAWKLYRDFWRGREVATVANAPPPVAILPPPYKWTHDPVAEIPFGYDLTPKNSVQSNSGQFVEQQLFPQPMDRNVGQQVV